MAQAVQKPDSTGSDRNDARNPSLSNPSITSIIPPNKQRVAAVAIASSGFCSGSSTTVRIPSVVSIDINANGPTDRCIDVPKTAYPMVGSIEVYKP
eukprot:gnl/MRDRNA2_/MRDRNA2_341394_c0_seq1.p2 gnl/MRDRNA2_/MRDRNA2_341394_c0~~gnl/MRDRNA2_/MRDRNA2_341394_c0_seq1.p2  ORF type:complete len:106 (-),score=15.38 gnl/MRDRNA2_/MRDRNA2_341394_c0_seq1:181-468(-)